MTPGIVGAKLVGIDYITIEGYANREFDSHHIVLGAGILFAAENDDRIVILVAGRQGITGIGAHHVDIRAGFGQGRPHQPMIRVPGILDDYHAHCWFSLIHHSPG